MDRMTNTLTDTIAPASAGMSDEARAAFVKKAADLLKPQSDLSNTLTRTQGPRPEVVIIPDPVIDAPAPIVVEAEQECPKCAEKIKAKAVVCRFCGHDFEKAEARRRKEERERREEERDEEVAPLGARLRRRQSSSSRLPAASPSRVGQEPASGTVLWWLLLVIGVVMVGVLLVELSDRHGRDRAAREVIEEQQREIQAERVKHEKEGRLADEILREAANQEFQRAMDEQERRARDARSGG